MTLFYIDHDKKNNKFKARMEMSDKSTTQKPLPPRQKLKQKAQIRVIDVIYTPGKEKPKRRPKNPQKNPPDRKIGFMHKRAEKAKKQGAE